MALSTVTVSGHLLKADTTAAVGTITFTPNAALLDVADNINIKAVPVTATLDSNGAFSVVLIGLDDSDLDPTDAAYDVVESIYISRSNYQNTELSVLLDSSPSTQNYASLTVATTAPVYFTYEPYGAVAAHEADTTSVHGITNTAVLETTTGAQTKATTAQAFAIQRANHTGTQASTTISDFTEGVQDVVGALGFGGSGLTATYNDGAGTLVVDINVDSSTVEVNADIVRVKAGGITNNEIAAAIKDPAAGTAGLRTLGTGSTQAAAGNDSRLSDSRTPTTHASTHASAASDPVTLAESQVTGLVADLQAKAMGLVPTAIKTSGYSAAAADFVLCDTTSTAFTVTLPAAPADRTRIAVKLVTMGTGNNITVTCGGSDHYNTTSGATSLTLQLAAQATQLQYISSTSVWVITANDLPLSQLDARFKAITATNNRQLNWYLDGVTTTGNGLGQTYKTDATLTLGVPWAMAEVAPITSAFTFDFQYATDPFNGPWTSVFSVLPSIAATAHESTPGTLSAATIASGKYVRLCVTAAGGTPAESVTLAVPGTS